jgi:uncharacterized membrane protein
LSAAAADILAQLVIVAAAAGAGAAAAWLAPRLRPAGAPDRSRARVVLLLAAAAGVFAVTFIFLANRKFDVFWAPAVDLGIQHQVFWAGSRGGFLYQTVLFARNHLNHVALMDQLISPLSLAFPSPRTLLVVQALALASAAFPAYLVARRHTASRYLALAFALSPLFFASTQWVALYDFHPRAFAPALVLWAFWAMEAGKPRLGLLFFFFTLLLLEELALYVCAAGLFLALALKQVRWGLLVAAFSAFHFLVATYVVYPQLMDVTDLASNPILHTFGVAGSPLDLIKYAARHPLFFIERAANPFRAAYLLHVMTPWAFLPAAAGWGWLAYVTPLTYALFSRVPSHHSIHYQYVMPLVPFLIYFAIRAWGRAEKWMARKGWSVGWARRAATAYLIFAGAASAAAFGPLGLRFNPSWYHAEPWVGRFPKVARFASPAKSLAASMFLLPHFSERPRIYLHPHKFRYVKELFPHEVIISTARLREPWTTPPIVSENRARITLVRLLRDKRYGCVYADGEYVMLRRGVTPVIPAKRAFKWTFQTLEEDAFDYNVGVPVYDERARNYRALYCAAEQGRLGTMARAGPCYWPPGSVKVSYRMMVSEPRRPFAPAAALVVVEIDGDGRSKAVAVQPVLPADLPRTGKYGWAAVAFECRKDRRYQFQLYPLGNGDIFLDYIYVEAPKLNLSWAFRNTKSDEEREALAAKNAALMRFHQPPPASFELR